MTRNPPSTQSMVVAAGTASMAWGIISSSATPSMKPVVRLRIICSRRWVRRISSGASPPASDASTTKTQ